MTVFYVWHYFLGTYKKFKPIFMTEEEFKKYQENREFRKGNYVIFIEKLNTNHSTVSEGVSCSPKLRPN